MEMRIHPDRPNDAIADGLPALKAYCTQLTFEEIIAYTRVHKSVVYYMYDLCSVSGLCTVILYADCVGTKYTNR